MADSRHRWTELDGLRAIAILGVMCFHAGVPWLQGGFYGVDVFFVLSGFLITTILLKDVDRLGKIDYRRFYIRRAKRLLPALGLLTVAFLIYCWTIAPIQLRETAPNVVWVWAYLGNWAQAYHWPLGNLGMLGHTWSLSVEEQFYWIWPMALIAILRRFPNRNHAALAALGASFAVVTWTLICGSYDIGGNTIYFRTDTNATSLLAGASLALWLSASEQANKGPRHPALVLSVGAALVGVPYFFPSAPMLPEGSMFQLSVGSVLMIWVLVTSAPRVAHIAMCWRPLVYIGNISYGLYLWHFPIYIAFDQIQWLTAHPFIEWILKGVLPLSVAAASYHLVERPILERRAKARDYRAVALPVTTD